MAGEFNINASKFFSKMKGLESNVYDKAKTGLEDGADDLTRVASDIVPFDKGTLSRSNSKTTKDSGNNVDIEIGFSVRESGFNYALWIHEGVYNHGAGTAQRSGTSGMSGKSYNVGRKYLQRPVEGEKDAYIDHIAKMVGADF